MGVSTCPDIAQEAIQNLLHDVLEEIEVYIDDITIFSNDWKGHMALVRKVLTKLQEAGFSVNLLKCEFVVQETDFLSYWMTLQGVKPMQKKVVFKYMPKGCKNQIVMAGHLVAILDMRTSTMSNTMNNQDSILMAPSTTTLVQGPYFSPQYQSEDHQQAQTPVDTTKGLWHLHLSGRGHPPLTVNLI